MSANPVDPLSLDFASLNTLKTVYRSKSFTEAAEHLGVNQSAVSYTIDRLRKVFHDPLFVREGGKQVATPRCNEIMETALKMLDDIQSLARPSGFHPQDAHDTVRIACNYYERMLIIPEIVNVLNKTAPNLKIEVVDARGVGHIRLLESQADILLGPFVRQEAGYYTRNLFNDFYVCMMDPAHPFAAREFTSDEYLSFENILITYGGKWTSAYLNELKEQDKNINITLSVPSPAGIEKLVHGSNLVATIPARLAKSIGKGLVVRDCRVRGNFDIGLVWTGRTHSSEMFKWIRQTIVDCIQETTST